MADIPEIANFHEEALEVIGHLVRDFKEINGDEDKILLGKMLGCVENGRVCFLAACAYLGELIELKREAE